MKRRDFFKALTIIPVAALAPSLVIASTSNPSLQGLETIINIIQNDPRLQRKVSAENRQDAVMCANRMNEILVESIIQTGAANDNKITTVDVREMNDFINKNYHLEWIELHGDDEGGVETGFHKVRGNGAKTKLFGKNAINKVADNIYHLGFESHLKNRLLNEDQNKNASYKKIATWLDALLRQDLEAGIYHNADVKEIIGNTDTGLDQVIDVIYQDAGLQKRISLGDIRMGARCSNEMNHFIVEAVQQIKTTKGTQFTVQDVKNINSYLVDNHAERWAIIHGDDEKKGAETGFHKVQSDGAKTQLYGKNAVNKVFDGVYHLGFETNHKRRLKNEDGNKNASFKKVAFWLNSLLENDLKNGVL